MFPCHFRQMPLIYDWTTYIVLRWVHRKHIRCPAVVYANHIESISSSIVTFTTCSITTDIIRLLPAYSLYGNVFTESLPSNESTCHITLDGSWKWSAYSSQKSNSENFRPEIWTTPIFFSFAFYISDYSNYYIGNKYNKREWSLCGGLAQDCCVLSLGVYLFCRIWASLNGGYEDKPLPGYDSV
jgi:hypothetical protein